MLALLLSLFVFLNLYIYTARKLFLSSLKQLSNRLTTCHFELNQITTLAVFCLISVFYSEKQI